MRCGGGGCAHAHASGSSPVGKSSHLTSWPARREAKKSVPTYGRKGYTTSTPARRTRGRRGGGRTPLCGTRGAGALLTRRGRSTWPTRAAAGRSGVASACRVPLWRRARRTVPLQEQRHEQVHHAAAHHLLPKRCWRRRARRGVFGVQSARWRPIIVPSGAYTGRHAQRLAGGSRGVCCTGHTPSQTAPPAAASSRAAAAARRPSPSTAAAPPLLPPAAHVPHTCA